MERQKNRALVFPCSFAAFTERKEELKHKAVMKRRLDHGEDQKRSAG